MQRRRVRLVDPSTQHPLDPAWSPLIDADELTEANSRLAASGLPWRWQPLPVVAALQGAITLQAPTCHAPP